jgi:hypothetical protein
MCGYSLQKLGDPSIEEVLAVAFEDKSVRRVLAMSGAQGGFAGGLSA